MPSSPVIKPCFLFHQRLQVHSNWSTRCGCYVAYAWGLSNIEYGKIFVMSLYSLQCCLRHVCTMMLLRCEYATVSTVLRVYYAHSTITIREHFIDAYCIYLVYSPIVFPEEQVFFSESQRLWCIVADSTQERQRTLHYHLYTIPTSFLTFHLSYDRLACYYQSFEGWMGSGLHNTRLFRLEKGKTAQTLRLHVGYGKLRSTRGCLDTEIHFRITLLRTILRFARSVMIVYVPFATSGRHRAMEIEVEDSEDRRRRHAEQVQMYGTVNCSTKG